MDSLKHAREELAADLKAKQEAVAKAQDKLTKFDSIFGDEVPVRKKPGPKPKAATSEAAPPEKPRGKPGPKPKPKTEPEAPAKPRGKPGPKPKAKVESEAKTETGKTAGKSRAAEGRRAVARGERPPIKQAMAHVMGGDTCNPAMVLERLVAKGWTPSAGDPKTYVGYMLSSTKEMFVRVPAKGRGFYRVKDGVSTDLPGSKAEVTEVVKTEAAPAPAKVETTEEKPAHKPKAVVNGAAKPSTDDILAEAGFDLSGPFGS